MRPKWLELDMWLLLVETMYGESNEIITLKWPWVALKGQIQGHSHVEDLYLVKEQS